MTLMKAWGRIWKCLLSSLTFILLGNKQIGSTITLSTTIIIWKPICYYWKPNIQVSNSYNEWYNIENANINNTWLLKWLSYCSFEASNNCISVIMFVVSFHILLQICHKIWIGLLISSILRFRKGDMRFIFWLHGLAVEPHTWLME